MGKRKANEVLLLDKVLNAQDAVKSGFANAIIPELEDEPDFFDGGLSAAAAFLYDSLR